MTRADAGREDQDTLAHVLMVGHSAVGRLGPISQPLLASPVVSEPAADDELLARQSACTRKRPLSSTSHSEGHGAETSASRSP
jgi:hypothetical protein